MIFNAGNRVYYISGRFGNTHSNPLKGGNYECEGTVTSTGYLDISVKWDNGDYNTYGAADLEHVYVLKSTDPNKLWEARRKR